MEAGFRALGAELEPVTAYTDANCMRCGSCMQGCSTNAGKSTMNTYIHDAWARGLLDLRANAAVERVLIEDGAATGVEYVDAAGERHTVRAGAVVVAAGTLNTPQLLLRSGLDGAAVGRNLGLHPVRLVYGLFDEPQDAHMVYPITAHCMDHQHDEDGGFVIEATTIQDPISFATTLSDESGPLWGPRLTEALRGFRHWVGLLAMANDDNNAAVVVDENGGERFDVDFQPNELERIDNAFRFSREVLEAAGATQIAWSGLASTHVQGTCRMGDDPARSVVDRNCESHDVKRLFVGDGSLVPRTLSVNPSLTIMALATRLARPPRPRSQRLPSRSRMKQGEAIWTPPADWRERFAMGRYVEWLRTERGLDFAGYDELWRWSVTDLEGFWASIWDFFGVRAHTPYERVLGSREMPGAEWFPGATLNYAEHMLGRDEDLDAVAIVAHSQTRETRELTFGELREQVARARAGLKRLGVGPGDRVVAYLPNIPETAVAFLAAASLGAIWATCPPEFGVKSVVDRLGQLEPKVLLAVGGYVYGEKLDRPRRERRRDPRAAAVAGDGRRRRVRRRRDPRARSRGTSS